MTRRRAVLILLLAAGIAACTSHGSPAQPELPQSIAPGWTRQTYAHSEIPQGIPAGTTPECWKAHYVTAAHGDAAAFLCGYAAEGSSFDALQRTPAAANTVKFQLGRFLVLIKWNGAAREEVTALVRALQKSLPKN